MCFCEEDRFEVVPLRRDGVGEQMRRSRGAVWAVRLSPSSACVARFAWGYGSEASPMLVDFLQKTKKKTGETPVLL